jgi:hypothetical protein
MTKMKKTWQQLEEGQSAMFDALLFFLLMLISSGILLYYTTNVQKPVTLITKQDRNLEFTYDLLVAYMTSTVNETSYKTSVDGNDVEIALEDEAVVEVVMEIMFIQKYNSGADWSRMAYDIYLSMWNLTHTTGISDPVVSASGINQTTYHFFFQARYDPPTGGGGYVLLSIPDHHNATLFKTYDSKLMNCAWTNSPADFPPVNFAATQRLAMLDDNLQKTGNLTLQLRLWKV